MYVSTVDRLGAQLSVADGAYADHLATGDARLLALDDVHHVDRVRVVLDLARGVAPAGVELVGAGIEQQPAGGELRVALRRSRKNDAPLLLPAGSASARVRRAWRAPGPRLRMTRR